MRDVHKTAVRDHYTAAGSVGEKSGVFPRRDKSAARFEHNLLCVCVGGGKGGQEVAGRKSFKNKRTPAPERKVNVSSQFVRSVKFGAGIDGSIEHFETQCNRMLVTTGSEDEKPIVTRTVRSLRPSKVN